MPVLVLLFPAFQQLASLSHRIQIKLIELLFSSAIEACEIEIHFSKNA